MLRILDNTLTTLDQCLPSKEDLHRISELLFAIGVDALEITVSVYKRMEHLPESSRFILNINRTDEIEKYPGFYRYVCRQELFLDNLIYEIQLNDSREIVKLRAYQGCRELRIVGLDDLLCNSYDRIMTEINHILPKTIINFCPENTYGCASALAVQWAIEYGKDVTTSFAGCKNNAATEEVLMALRLATRYKPNRDLTVLPELTKIYEKFTQRKVGNKKPIIGKNIFQVEAGIHADGIKKNPATYEAYKPCSVGGKTELVIGKHSGTKAILLKLEELEITFPGETVVEELLRKIKKICTENRKSLKDEEFIKLVKGVAAIEGNQIHC